MDISKKGSKEKPKSSLKVVFTAKYRVHATISSSESDEKDEKIVYMDDLEKRKEAYGTCGECGEPGTGELWCLPCNAKRFEENFKNWTSGNENIDKFIQHSQLHAVHRKKCLEWIPFEDFQKVTYIAKGGFGQIFSADWPEGYIYHWDIENQKWNRDANAKVALKSLNDSSDINADFLNEIKSHLQIYFRDIIQCYGITRDPKTKDYMMVLKFCDEGNLRDYLNNSKISKDYASKLNILLQIARGLLEIHNAGKVHKDFHSGNILFIDGGAYISDLGMCQPANEDQSVKKSIFGVLPYMAPEVLCGRQYTKAADIYSFGIIMNEFMSEENPYNDVPHDQFLTVRICRGERPKISEYTPKLLADLIKKCWDAKAENRPSANELWPILKKWSSECDSSDSEYDINSSEIYSQMKECEKIKESRLKNSSNKNISKIIQTHPEAIYTSRLLYFKDLPEPVNSSDLSSVTSSSTLISDIFDCQLSESELIEINQGDKSE